MSSTVLTGAEVLPAARFFRPDAMILDISVPGISGYAVAQVTPCDPAKLLDFLASLKGPTEDAGSS
jgi:hypothetical protein